MTAVADPGRAVGVAEYVHALTELWDRVRLTKAALESEEKELLGSVARPPEADEQRRMAVACRAAAGAVVQRLVAAAEYAYNTRKATESLTSLLSVHDELRAAQRSLLEREEEVVVSLLSQHSERGGKPLTTGPSVAADDLAAHLAQLRRLLHRFDAAESSAVEDLRRRCQRAVDQAQYALPHRSARREKEEEEEEAEEETEETRVGGVRPLVQRSVAHLLRRAGACDAEGRAALERLLQDALHERL